MFRPASKEFRQDLIEWNPKLKHQPYMSLFRKLLFSDVEHLDTYNTPYETLVVPHNYLAAINHEEPTHFKSGQFLQEFRRDVLPNLAIQDYIARETARVVVDKGIPVEVYDLVERYREEEKEVFLENGRKVTDTRTISANYENAVGMVDAMVKTIERTSAANPKRKSITREAVDILNHHNHVVTSVALTRIMKPNLEEAEALVESYRGESHYTVTRDIFDRIKVFSKPVLIPSLNGGDRLFSYEPNITNIKSDVRKVLTRGCTEIDLTSSQLAIAAGVWPVPALQEFLSNGGNIWEELLRDFRGDVKTVKPSLKTAIYSTMYGMAREKVYQTLQEALKGSPYDADRFYTHPLIEAIYDARDEAQERLSRVPTHPITGDLVWFDKYHARRLALEAQAVELKIIHAVYELQKTTTDFKIILYQFDGLTLKFRSLKRKQYWLDRIDRVVREAGEAFNVPASITVDELE